MKKDIHPKWYPKAKVICACGNTFTVGSTEPELRIEICSACHPFFTGQEKFIDTEGRVERFERKRAEAEAVAKKLGEKRRRKKERERKEKEKPRTLKEMLEKTK